MLASASNDRTVILWDVTDPARPTRTAGLTGHRRAVRAVAFSPDGHWLASGSGDRTVIVWDVTDPARPTRRGALTHQRPGWLVRDGWMEAGVNAVGFRPDGRLLACGSDRSVILWDVTDPTRPTQRATVTHLRRVSRSGPVKAVGFSPDGRLLATGARDPKNTGILWDVADPAHPVPAGTILPMVRSWAETSLFGGSPAINAVAFSLDGRLLATGSGDFGVAGNTGGSWQRGALVLWDVADAANPVRVATLTPDGSAGTGQVYAVVFGPHGRSLACAGDAATVDLWDVTDPAGSTLTAALTGHRGVVRAASFSPDSRLLASGGDDQTVRLWDVA